MKVNLNQQLEELERLLADAPTWTKRERPGIAAYRQERLKAAIQTLRWLHQHEPTVRAAVNGGKQCED